MSKWVENDHPRGCCRPASPLWARDTPRAVAVLAWPEPDEREEAEKAGCRAWWRCFRDFNPNLASICNEPEFKAVFADIERDMAQQRARLAARPKDAALEPTPESR